MHPLPWLRVAAGEVAAVEARVVVAVAAGVAAAEVPV